MSVHPPRTAGKTFSEARAIHRQNPGSQWHALNKDPDDSEGRFAFQRLSREIFEPFIKPRFKLPRDSSFFMIGSCFARGLERALRGAGFDVQSYSKELDVFATDRAGVTALGATNRYNTGSILNEIRWALDPSSPFPNEAAIVDLDEKLCVDPHMSPVFSLANRETTERRRAIFHTINKRLSEVDVIVITPGLVEVWIDTELDLVINGTPDARLARRYPERFRFRRLKFAENMDNLEEAHALLKKFGKPGHRIIITTSPVPLSNTFTDEDIVISNTYSKSLLRTASTEFAERHDNVDYFPSYEIVMNSDRRAAWMEDKRHVRGAVAQSIMRLFARDYIHDGAVTNIKIDAESVY